jgi:hypothetical protein
MIREGGKSKLTVRGLWWESAARKPPINASPHPVVSMTSAEQGRLKHLPVGVVRGIEIVKRQTET